MIDYIIIKKTKPRDLNVVNTTKYYECLCFKHYVIHDIYYDNTDNSHTLFHLLSPIYNKFELQSITSRKLINFVIKEIRILSH